jgi:hypothetical protein
MTQPVSFSGGMHGHVSPFLPPPTEWPKAKMPAQVYDMLLEAATSMAATACNAGEDAAERCHLAGQALHVAQALTSYAREE